MKTLRFFGMAFIAVFTCVNFASCSNDENEFVPQETKKVMVSLGFGGDFEISESPLSRASTNDLYFIQVGQGDGSSAATMCAYGLFDDVSKMNIILPEGEKYYFYASILKDAKDILKHTDYTYEYDPFIFKTKLTNEFIFSDEDAYNASESERIGAFNNYFHYSDNKAYQIPNLDFYWGYTNKEYTVAENSKVTIDMMRWSFGANFIAENLTEGYVKIRMTKYEYTSPTIKLTPSQPSNDDIYGYTPLIVAGTSDRENINLSVSFIWVKSDETEIDLGTPTINFKRNIKTNIKINVDNSIENSIEFNYENSGEMNIGDTYIVNGNTIYKETTE